MLFLNVQISNVYIYFLIRILRGGLFPSSPLAGLHLQDYQRSGAHQSSVTRTSLLLCVTHVPRPAFTSVFLSLYRSLRNFYIVQVVSKIADSHSSNR